MEIKPKTKLCDLLKAYPKLERHIINFAPPFKNDFLRRVFGKMVTVQKLAQITKQDAYTLVNKLRYEVGQNEIPPRLDREIQWHEGEPQWIQNQPAAIINGTEMFSHGIHPLSHINEMMQDITKDQFVVLKTNFKPQRIIDAMKKDRYTIYCKMNDQNHLEYFTFIRK